MAVPGGVWRGNLLDLPGLAPYQRPAFRSLMDNPQPTPGGGNSGPDPFTGGLMDGSAGREGPGTNPTAGGSPATSQQSAQTDWGGAGQKGLGIAGGLIGGPVGLAMGAASTGIAAARDKDNANTIASRMGVSPSYSPVEGMFANTMFGGMFGLDSFSKQAADQSFASYRDASVAPDAPGVEAFGGPGYSNPEGEGIVGRDQTEPAPAPEQTAIEQALAALASIAASGGGSGLGGISPGAGGPRGEIGGVNFGFGAIGTPSNLGFSDLFGGTPAPDLSPAPAPDTRDTASPGTGGGGTGAMGGHGGTTDGNGNSDPDGNGNWARGGPIRGRGLLDGNPPGPDDAIIGAQRGEYMIKKDAAKHYGPGLLAALNAKKISKAKLRSLMDA